MALNKDILKKIALLKSEGLDLNPVKLDLEEISRRLREDDSQSDGNMYNPDDPAPPDDEDDGSSEVDEEIEAVEQIDPVKEVLRIEDLGRTVFSLEAGIKSRSGFLKTPGFWSSIFSAIGSLKSQGLNPSLNPDVIKFNESLNYDGGIVAANERAAANFSSFIGKKHQYFQAYFNNFLIFLRSAGLVSSNDIAQSGALSNMKDLKMQYNLSLVNKELGVLNKGSTINVASTIIKDMNEVSKQILDFVKEQYDVNVSGRSGDRGINVSAAIILNDIESENTDYLKGIGVYLGLLEGIINIFHSSQEARRYENKKKTLPIPDYYSGSSSPNTQGDYPSPDSEPTGSGEDGKETAGTSVSEVAAEIPFSMFGIVADQDFADGIIAGNDRGKYLVGAGESRAYFSIPLRINLKNFQKEEELSEISKIIFNRAISEGKISIDTNRIDISPITTAITQDNSGYYLVVGLPEQFIRNFKSEEEMIRVNNDDEGYQNILSLANLRLFNKLQKIAESQTTVLYETVDPDGNSVSFTPADLVMGGGKIKSKGKSFKPKKIKGKSLSSIVNSKSFGKVKRR